MLDIATHPAVHIVSDICGALIAMFFVYMMWRNAE
jgi:hypothetical protein